MKGEADQNPLVIKFGGTSVGSGAAIGRAAAIAAGAARGRPVAVVVSAMSGVTNLLLGHASGAPDAGGAAAMALRETLAERHLRAIHEAVPPERRAEVENRVLGLLDELVEAAGRPAESVKARRAGIAVFGERLSAEVLAGAVAGTVAGTVAGAVANAGVAGEVVEVDPIATDRRFDEAEVDARETEGRCSRYVVPVLERGAVAVVPGFVGRAPDGSPTTLGRGGSDLSATVIGRALGSREVWIMSDVDGVLDADPRLVPDAALMPRLSYHEAHTFAGLGAKILHHKTMVPAAEARMDVLVRNTFAPETPGTRISADFAGGSGVRCVALRRKVPMEIPCASGRRSETAMVVCIGSPSEADLKLGLRLLRKAKIRFLHAGFASAGLVFVVNGDQGEDALRLLHGSLVMADPGVEEVA
ncbi:MAG: Aspartokinase [uncultured Rubrobacteraceae bacterium]|uniref:Aspartokinase n=1 Tax=uncultured Rubrobacteraceae bacterium TaxID=349277 RepID=A0A6J4RLT7_9ACTN|nr:MAG: Aspartokinase [uncultured Rubrobacteraceae bacterium]